MVRNQAWNTHTCVALLYWSRAALGEQAIIFHTTRTSLWAEASYEFGVPCTTFAGPGASDVVKEGNIKNMHNDKSCLVRIWVRGTFG